MFLQVVSERQSLEPRFSLAFRLAASSLVFSCATTSHVPASASHSFHSAEGVAGIVASSTRVFEADLSPHLRSWSAAFFSLLWSLVLPHTGVFFVSILVLLGCTLIAPSLLPTLVEPFWAFCSRSAVT